MARIPEAQIERLKEAVPVVRLVEASGIELKKGGKDLIGRCPFHEDATASLVVTPAKNRWHCFGCGVGGGPIDWVMKRQGVSFRHAVELLRADAGSGAGLAEQGTTRRAKLPAPVALDAGEHELLDQVIGYYYETLLASPEALACLERRGIASRELIEQLKLPRLGTLRPKQPRRGRRVLESQCFRGQFERVARNNHVMSRPSRQFVRITNRFAACGPAMGIQ